MELLQLRPRLRGLDEPVVWVTFDTPQSRSQLAGEEVVYARHTLPRDFGNVVRNTVLAAQVLRRTRARTVVSTGSGIALSFLPMARVRGLSCHFIETVALTQGTSVTGRIVSWLPGMKLYTQYPGRASTRWRYAGSVFDGYVARPNQVPDAIRRVVVTLGTNPYGFRRLVDRMLEILPPEVEVLWQTGVTDVADLPIEGRAAISTDEFDRALRESDVVVAHAGAGSTLASLEAGRFPVLVPRRWRYGEQIDDHQLQTADRLNDLGVALVRSVEQLTYDDLVAAAAVRIESPTEPPSFQLQPG